jgi:hypothetical protein
LLQVLICVYPGAPYRRTVFPAKPSAVKEKFTDPPEETVVVFAPIAHDVPAANVGIATPNESPTNADTITAIPILFFIFILIFNNHLLRCRKLYTSNYFGRT